MEIGGINPYLAKGGGEVAALNELPLKSGTVLWDETLSSFHLDRKKVEPQINVYPLRAAERTSLTFKSL